MCSHVGVHASHLLLSSLPLCCFCPSLLTTQSTSSNFSSCLHFSHCLSLSLSLCLSPHIPSQHLLLTPSVATIFCPLLIIFPRNVMQKFCRDTLSNRVWDSTSVFSFSSQTFSLVQIFIWSAHPRTRNTYT